MASGAAGRTVGWSGTVALLALLAGLTTAPSQVTAACLPPATLGGMAHLEGLAAIGALAPLDADASRPGSLPMSPCAGLRCSAGDPFSPAPTAPWAGVRAESWGLLPGQVLAAGSGPLRFPLLDEPTAHPFRWVITLLRPPR